MASDEEIRGRGDVFSRLGSRERSTSRSSRYKREGNLSPLRSPLREETKPQDKRRGSRNHRSRAVMPRWADANSGPACWQTAGRPDNSLPLSDRDFPTLDNARNSAQSSKRSQSESHTSPRDTRASKWSRLSSQEENVKPSSPPFSRQSSRDSSCSQPLSEDSFSDLMEEEVDRRNRVLKDLDRLKKTRNLDEQGLPLKNGSPKPNSVQYEVEEETLIRRQKQIDYGKRTAGYKRYTEVVPKSRRMREHPRTPYKFSKYSRRAWDTKVRLWRKLLHYYDPPGAGGPADTEETEGSQCSSSTTQSEPEEETETGVRNSTYSCKFVTPLGQNMDINAETS